MSDVYILVHIMFIMYIDQKPQKLPSAAGNMQFANTFLYLLILEQK